MGDCVAIETARVRRALRNDARSTWPKYRSKGPRAGQPNRPCSGIWWWLAKWLLPEFGQAARQRRSRLNGNRAAACPLGKVKPTLGHEIGTGRELMTKRVIIPADSLQLEGDLAIPQNATGVVLFAHGSGSSRLSPRNQFVAEALQHIGIGTLLFDLLT
jgi:hypothetical protein